MITRGTAPETHPIVKAATAIGYGSLAHTSQQLDTELRGNIAKVGNAEVTQSWVRATAFTDPHVVSNLRVPILIVSPRSMGVRPTGRIRTGRERTVV